MNTTQVVQKKPIFANLGKSDNIQYSTTNSVESTSVLQHKVSNFNHRL